MVVKLIGTINGDEVVFKKEEGDMWKATIPKNLNGEYVIELQAYDEAGNMGYMAKYIMTIDVGKLYLKLEAYPYYSKIVLSDFYCILKEESRCT